MNKKNKSFVFKVGIVCIIVLIIALASVQIIFNADKAYYISDIKQYKSDDKSYFDNSKGTEIFVIHSEEDKKIVLRMIKNMKPHIGTVYLEPTGTYIKIGDTTINIVGQFIAFDGGKRLLYTFTQKDHKEINKLFERLRQEYYNN
ncbi:hypothetical protein SH1V18_28790 [Vallitalea longa]|uniref:Uncharacterized protein n=1 Tax=Vallitalea longa TaxID=2936439 RepID=A0A9W5YEC6_9FIRM|nr:hypothetical protein [Vallitalea longa]GKX30399.1 hypothetical protein SH1V18_28790 [Vallitalea longa]